MKTVIFLCHGNICRSSASEFVFKYLVKQEGRENEFHIYSRGVSNEEYGNDIYPPMKRALDRAGIPYERHFAQRITAEEYAEADYIFYMDRSNLDLALWRIPDTKAETSRASNSPSSTNTTTPSAPNATRPTSYPPTN